MDLGDQYLRFIWNTFNTNLALSSRELFNERSFTDVTLVSDDLQVTAAHRLVLSRSSSTFQKLLMINSSANSTLYLRGINQNVLDLILQFIYTGEVDVPTDEITDFLKAANDLDISELKNRPQSSYNEAQSTDSSYAFFIKPNFLFVNVTLILCYTTFQTVTFIANEATISMINPKKSDKPIKYQLLFLPDGCVRP